MAAAHSRVIKNAPFRGYAKMLDWVTGQLNTAGLTMTANISKDGAAFSGTGVTATEIGTNTGVAYYEITAAEMGSSATVVRITDAASATFFDVLIPEPCSDSGVCQAGSASGTIVLRAAASAVDSYYNGLLVELVAGTGAGQFACITGYTGSTQTATVDRQWTVTPDNTTVYKIGPMRVARQSEISGVGGYADVNLTHINRTGLNSNGANFFSAFALGQIADASPLANSFTASNATGLSAVNNAYRNQLLIFTTGSLATQALPISAYDASTRRFTLRGSFTSTPVNSTYFIITGYVPN